MEYDGKKWRLVDDPICDVEEWQSVPADCRECELFYDCYLVTQPHQWLSQYSSLTINLTDLFPLTIDMQS